MAPAKPAVMQYKCIISKTDKLTFSLVETLQQLFIKSKGSKNGYDGKIVILGMKGTLCGEKMFDSGGFGALGVLSSHDDDVTSPPEPVHLNSSSLQVDVVTVVMKKLDEMSRLFTRMIACEAKTPTICVHQQRAL